MKIVKRLTLVVAVSALCCAAAFARPLVVGVTEQWIGGRNGREGSPRAGVAEAIEYATLPVVGVQFHPEELVKYADDEHCTRLFRNLPEFIGFKP